MAEFSKEWIEQENNGMTPDFSIKSIFNKLKEGESKSIICEGFGITKIINDDNVCFVEVRGKSISYEELIGNKLKKNIDLPFQIGLSLFSIFAFLFFHFYKFEEPQVIPTGIFKYVFLYLGGLIFLSIFKKYKIVEVLLFILWIIPGLFLLLKPIIDVIGTLFFTLVFAVCIVGGLFLLLIKGFNIELEIPLQLYILLTLSSIIMTTFNNKIIEFWHWMHEKPNSKNYKDVAIKLIGQDKIRYFLFIIFFLSLLIFNVMTLGNWSDIDFEKYSNPIIQAFVTYIAYDSVYSNWNKIMKNKSSH